MSADQIVIRGARVHNLRSVDLTLPKNRLICFTGVSGSGKSSMAFDTIYAEGQRRYIESLSAYARQFMEQMEKPDVDQISGLPPAISIEQKAAGGNPRSTVGTMTEVYDYLRVLYARLGTLHCVQCGKPITGQTRDRLLDQILNYPEGTRLNILAPMARGRQGEFLDLFEELQRQGFVRARVDGRIVNLSEDPGLDRHAKHNVDVVVDRLVMREGIRSRLAEAVDTALNVGNGTLIVNLVRDSEDPGTDTIMGTAYACAECGISYEEPTPQLFSFNIPTGMCPTCLGLGTQVKINRDLLVTDPSKSLREGALATVDVDRNRWLRHLYHGVLHHFGDCGLDTPWKDIPELAKEKLLYGLDGQRIRFRYARNPGERGWTHLDTFEGIIPMLERKFRESKDEGVKEELGAFTSAVNCPDCGGMRLRPEARAVKLGGLSLPELCAMPIEEAHGFLATLPLSSTERQIGQDALNEIVARLEFLMNVGLRYLSIDRTAPTLSGGEAQRIRLASQIGSGLVGVLYVLDEPSIGLHHRDNHRLLNALGRLRDLGNTVIVVEHDEDTMRAADIVVDFGPGPGVRGGTIVGIGSAEDLTDTPDSITGDYLAGRRRIEIPETRRRPNGNWLQITGARHNNLKNIDVKIPLGVFVCVTGVSGSGKSSLITDTLLPALMRHFFHARLPVGPHDAISGIEYLDKVIHIDQSPIGRTPRSNPATYTGALDPIRRLFAELPEAKVRGYTPGRFSFNVKSGRCDACEGNGATRVQMDFLADVWMPCPACNGARFNAETLQIRFKGKNIADVLDMDVQEAFAFFENIPAVHRVLRTLHDVGLDYMKLGQPSPTLSGGEAQRIKLARELCRRSTGRTLYILDEPTTGLHFHDVSHLLEVLHRFCDEGNTVVVIEHNMDVVKTADWILDLGPEGGDEGGRLIAAGTPEEVAEIDGSWTGQVLRDVLRGEVYRRVTSRVSEEDGHRRAAIAFDRDEYRPMERITDITVVGAREHNLKNVSLAVPREKLVVFSGVSGSGKTSMALDTIYAEGQRRYVESLSAYARQFLGDIQKPKVDQVEGLSPAIAIEQKGAGRNPRSTVGTITEIYDYLRVIYAQIGEVYCPDCQIPAGAQSSSEVVERLTEEFRGKRIMILAPLETENGGDYDDALGRLRKEGYLRCRVDGVVHRLDEGIELDRRRNHSLEAVIDRLEISDGERGRLGEAVETAFNKGEGRLVVAPLDGGDDIAISRHISCPSCGKSFEKLTPQMFAFNRAHDISASGMCPACQGLGTQQGLAEAAVIRSEKLSIAEGAVNLWGKPKGMFRALLESAGNALGFDLHTPLREMTQAARTALFLGDESRWISCTERGIEFQYLGVFPAVDRTLRLTPQLRDRLGQVLSDVPCSTCGGTRLIPQSRAARLRGVPIAELCSWPLSQTRAFFDQLSLSPREQQVVGEVLTEIRSRLRFLEEVGLGYISLDRRAPTLSGGEAQRIRLASQIGSGLTGVLYVLDEPTIGLHPRDNALLLSALEHLRDLNNTVIVVEHDSDTLNKADYVVDFGPGAGTSGGEVVATGTPGEIGQNQASLTGAFLSGRRAVPVPRQRRAGTGKAIEIIGAREHNLKDIHAVFPLGTMTVVTGVSGSGKSTLVNDTLHRALACALHKAQFVPGAHDEVRGTSFVDKVILIDQEPIGSSSLSNPATYSGVLDVLRELFAQVPEAKMRGYTARRFSTNVPGGRCERCWGYGKRHIEMHFLPDVWVECEDCHGLRYNRETLEITFGGVSIGEVLQMPVEVALEHFQRVPRVRRLLQTLCDVGLGYMELGQSATTLSGGEAQRLKLASELARPSTGRTVYILDEPTTGLHFADTERLLDVLNRLVDQGNTVIMIEHNVLVIQAADWIIDLGPEGGDAGGYIVVAGTPEDVAACETSHTGAVLRRALAHKGPAVSKRKNAREAIALVETEKQGLEKCPEEEDVPSEGPAPPWKTDGIAWHTSDNRLREGRQPLWKGALIFWIIDQIKKIAPVSVVWSNQHLVSVYPERARRWIAFRTDSWQFVTMEVRVPKGSFDGDKLRKQLDLKPFDEIDDVPLYGSWSRVTMNGRIKTWTMVEIVAFRQEELDTEGFRGFLRAAYQLFMDHEAKGGKARSD